MWHLARSGSPQRIPALVGRPQRHPGDIVAAEFVVWGSYTAMECSAPWVRQLAVR
jgi:hypothetical protein